MKNYILIKKIVFTGKDKELEGFYYNGVFWKNIGINNAEISKTYFQKLYSFCMSEFYKVEDNYDEEEKKKIFSNIKSLDSAKTN